MMPGTHPERAAAAGRGAGPAGPPTALRAMLEARSVAVVGASARPGSFGARMLAEVGRSAARPVIYPVNPRYRRIGDRGCYPSLADLPAPADLVLFGVPDAALEEQLTRAGECGSRSAVIFGNAYEKAAGHVASSTVGPLVSSGQHRGSHGVVTGAAEAALAATSSPTLRQRLAAIALSAGMELCGAGCMGFANVTFGLRAMGYVEPDPLPAGPVALVTHSGSVFSALLRTRRAIGFTLAVSSGQELVTAAPSYLTYALELPQTKVLALVLEAIRQPDALRCVLASAAGRGLPVVLLTAGNSAAGRAMVTAHSGALAGSDAAWEALVRRYGLHRVSDLGEMTDTLEMFVLTGRRRRSTRPTGPATAPPNSIDGPLMLSQRHERPIDVVPADAGAAPGGEFRPIRGIATVHDSGLERAHVADLAADVGVPFAEISDGTRVRLAALLDPGLVPGNPLDVWGTGADTRQLLANSLTALADDDAVDAVALAVDLIPELDGDQAYWRAVLDTAARTSKPLAVLSNMASAIDPDAAASLRSSGIPVFEGTRSGLRAFRHLLDQLAAEARASPPTEAGAGLPAGPAGAAEPARAADPARSDRALALVAAAAQDGTAPLALLREYGIQAARAERVTSGRAAAAAAARIGYPVVLKTDQPGLAHKSDVGGVIAGIANRSRLAAAYADLAQRLGPAALVCQAIPAGPELALGVVRDPALGPLIVVGAGGTLVELIADRAVALPRLTCAQAADLVEGLKVRTLLAGARGAPPADLDAIARAVAALAELATELGDHIEALDINPLICGPGGAIAVDALVIPRG
jgi:acetate---CoA ligase (ADP-forming)